MISMVQKIPSGNGLCILLMPPAGIKRIRILRKDADTFTGFDDAAALLIADGSEKYVVDVAGLYNGVKVYYRAYYWDGVKWSTTATVGATPEDDFADVSVDALTIVRDRVDLGLQAYIARGMLSHPSGAVPTMTASPLIEEVPLPVVTLHLASDSSEQRFIGDTISHDVYSEADEFWHSMDGYYSRVQLTIVAWCLNADERISLRRALKSILLANQPVFDAAGMMQIDMQFSDQEDFVTYAAPIYQAICNFTCYAPSGVESTDPAILDVITTLIV